MKRRCKVCKEKFEWNGKDWQTHCKDCYLEHARKCEGKGCEKFIKISAPKWVKICTECFLKKRGKTHGTCPLCPPERADYLSRKMDEPACSACMAKDPKMKKFFLKRYRPEKKKEKSEKEKKEEKKKAKKLHKRGALD